VHTNTYIFREPTKLNHHNVGYTDEHSGFGFIYDGEQWLSERIDVIMEILLETKKKDLLKIHDEIKYFLSDDINKTIKGTLDNLNDKLHPRNKIDANSKRILIAHLKKHFCNNKHLVLDAKKHTEKHVTNNNHKNNYKNILREGLTIESIDQKITLKKELARTLLKNNKMISNEDFESMIYLIDETSDISILNIINNSLNHSLYHKTKINSNIIQKKILKRAEMEKLFG